jgi:hypothetical protein
MPLYFFHLTFGDRISLDAEGVELPSRSAACEEAMAVVSELSDPALGGNPRRWASWFLQVADEHGAFLRAPIGYPALQLVSEDHEAACRQVRAAMLVWLNLLRDSTAHFLARERQLRCELLCEFLTKTRLQVCQPVPSAPHAAGRSATYRAAAKPTRRRPPDLVVLPGGR